MTLVRESREWRAIWREVNGISVLTKQPKAESQLFALRT